MYFIVRFTRETADDLDVVKETLNHLGHDPERQLLEQFKLELTENPALRGLWTVLRQEPGTVQYFVWVGVNWTGTLRSLVATLQDTYDTCGMAGSFEVLDLLPQCLPTDGRYEGQP